MTLGGCQSVFMKYLSSRGFGQSLVLEAPWAVGSSHSRGRKDWAGTDRHVPWWEEGEVAA